MKLVNIPDITETFTDPERFSEFIEHLNTLNLTMGGRGYGIRVHTATSMSGAIHWNIHMPLFDTSVVDISIYNDCIMTTISKKVAGYGGLTFNEVSDVEIKLPNTDIIRSKVTLFLERYLEQSSISEFSYYNINNWGSLPSYKEQLDSAATALKHANKRDPKLVKEMIKDILALPEIILNNQFVSPSQLVLSDDGLYHYFRQHKMLHLTGGVLMTFSPFGVCLNLDYGDTMTYSPT